MISSAPSLSYLPLDTTESPKHKAAIEVFSLCKYDLTDSKQEIKIQLEIAHHINRGALIFEGNVLVLQALHGDNRQRESLLGR